MVIPILSNESFHSSRDPCLLLNIMMNFPIPDFVMIALLLGENPIKIGNILV